MKKETILGEEVETIIPRTTGDPEGMILVHLAEVAATPALTVANLDRKEVAPEVTRGSVALEGTSPTRSLRMIRKVILILSPSLYRAF